MKFQSGFLTVGRFGHAPIRIHWSTPIGTFVLTGMSFVPHLWAAFVLIILVHEIGHALFVRRFRLFLVSIDIHGFGGACRYSGSTSEERSSIIAWGGVLAQLVLLAFTEIALRMLHTPGHTWMRDLLKMMITANAIVLLVNLLPIAPLDGYEAWRLFRPSNFARWRRRRVGAEARELEHKLRTLRGDAAEEKRWLN